MPAATYARGSFHGGEWSQTMQGRVDLKEYLTALNVCYNSYPTETGSWQRRSGTQLVTPTRQGAPGRCVSYDFKQATPYNIIFTDSFIRFTTGPAVVMTNDSQVVVSISSANPAVVTTTTNHGWTNGQYVRFSLLGQNNPLLQNREFVISVAGTNVFSLSDAITGASIDGSTLGAFVSGTVSRVLELASPYSAASWATVRSVPTDNNGIISAVLLQGGTAPWQLTVTAQAVGPNFATFSLAQPAFTDGPYLDPVAGGALITPSAATGIITLEISFPAYSASVAYTVGSFVSAGGVNYESLVDQNFNNAPAGSPSDWAPVSPGVAINNGLGFLGTDVGRSIRLKDSAANWTWGRITGSSTLIDPASAGFVDIGNVTLLGGLAACFNGTTDQNAATCGSAQSTASTAIVTNDCYVGQNYSGGSAQKIYSGTLWPSNNLGFGVYTMPSAQTLNSITINLRAKATAPANASDGTLLGSLTYFSNPVSPATIVSNDQTTSWNYVWFEVVFAVNNPSGRGGSKAVTVSTYIAQAQFFNPTGTGSSTGVTFEILGPALADTSSLSIWRMGLYSNTTGWPTCGTYHEGRLWLAGVISNRIDASNSNDIFNFAPTAANGTVGNGNAIAYIFNAPDVNTIFWMEPDALGIICGTQRGEWLVQASTLNNPLTPTSIQAHRVTKNGCANVEPRRTEHTLAVVKRFSRKILEFFADIYSGKLQAPNLTLWSKHMTVSGIQEIAYQEELVPIIWARLGSGNLMGITYKRETLSASQPPEIMGAHRHTLGSGRFIEYITVGPSQGGDVDALSLVTNDPASNVRHVELLTDAWEETDVLADAWFLDDALIPSSSVINFTSGVAVSTTLNGLWYLNGQTVSVFAGGLDCGDYTVANGAVTVPFGDGVAGGTASGLFTFAFINSFAAGIPYVVGFNYLSQGQGVRPASMAESGARNGPAVGKMRRTHNFAMNLNTTAGLKVGGDFSHLRSLNFRSGGGTPFTPLQMFSGIWWDTLDDTNSFDSMVAWQSVRMMPANLLTLSGNVQTQDR